MYYPYNQLWVLGATWRAGKCTAVSIFRVHSASNVLGDIIESLCMKIHTGIWMQRIRVQITVCISSEYTLLTSRQQHCKKYALFKKVRITLLLGFKAKISYHPVGKNTQVRHNPVYYFRKYQVRARSPPIHSWAQYVNAHMEGNATST